MTLKINQSVSKDAQSRTLLKELLKVHQIHQAYALVETAINNLENEGK